VSTSPLQQIPSTAIDAAGLSITTAIKSPIDPRPGAIYEPVNLAAAAPVHFHPTTSPSLGGTNFLMLNNQRWTAATLSTTHPGYYSAHTADNNPNWVQVNAATGGVTAINSGYEIPMSTANDSRTLTAAASRGNDMFWTLNSVTQDSNTVAVVQHWHNNTAVNTVNLRGEETIPTATNGAEDDPIVFSSGIQWSSTTTPYMYVYGTGSTTNNVYMARKKWARVGYVGTPTNQLDTQWEVYTGTGWSPDPTTAGAVMTTSGPLTSVGPLSFAHHGIQRGQRAMTTGLTGYNFVATVVAAGSARSAQIYSSLGGRPWQPTGSPVSLGTAGITYLGGTLQFQGPVGPNPTMIDPANSSSAVPYVTSVLTTSGGDSSIVNTWGLMQVGRFS